MGKTRHISDKDLPLIRKKSKFNSRADYWNDPTGENEKLVTTRELFRDCSKNKKLVTKRANNDSTFPKT